MIIKLNVQVEDKLEALRKVASLAKQYKKVDDETIYFEALVKREEAFTTGCGSGIAIPHGKSHTVKEHGVIICKLVRGIRWEAIDEEDVDLIIGLTIPEENFDEECLKSQSKLACALINPVFINQMKSLENTECIKQMMQEVMK